MLRWGDCNNSEVLWSGKSIENGCGSDAVPFSECCAVYVTRYSPIMFVWVIWVAGGTVCTVPVYIKLYLSFMKRWVVRVSNKTVNVKGRCLSSAIPITVCAPFHFTSCCGVNEITFSLFLCRRITWIVCSVSNQRVERMKSCQTRVRLFCSVGSVRAKSFEI